MIWPPVSVRAASPARRNRGSASRPPVPSPRRRRPAGRCGCDAVPARCRRPAPGVDGRAESAEEGPPLFGREVADFQDGGDVARRDRHRIAGAGDLADEALVLVECRRQALPQAGGPTVDTVAQVGLVGGDQAARSGASTSAMPARLAMASLDPAQRRRRHRDAADPRSSRPQGRRGRRPCRRRRRPPCRSRGRRRRRCRSAAARPGRRHRRAGRHGRRHRARRPWCTGRSRWCRSKEGRRSEALDRHRHGRHLDHDAELGHAGRNAACEVGQARGRKFAAPPRSRRDARPSAASPSAARWPRHAAGRGPAGGTAPAGPGTGGCRAGRGKGCSRSAG